MDDKMSSAVMKMVRVPVDYIGNEIEGGGGRGGGGYAGEEGKGVAGIIRGSESTGEGVGGYGDSFMMDHRVMEKRGEEARKKRRREKRVALQLRTEQPHSE